MSEDFEKLMLQEFKKVNNKLDNIEQDVTELKQDVAVLKEEVAELKDDVSGLKEDVAVLKDDVSGLKEDVAELKYDVSGLKEDVAILKEDVSGLKEDVTGLKNRMDRLEYKMDISNANISSMLERQNDLSNEIKIGHKELLNKFEKYEETNELEHSRLNYEICKLKARA